MKARRRHILMHLKWYHPKLHLGIAQYAKEHDWHLSDHSANHSWYHQGWQGDGVICSNFLQSDRYLEFLNGIDAPKVAMGTPNATQRFPSVCSNDDAIAQMAIDYFWERGIRRFACFWMFGYQSRRLSLFSERLQERDMSCFSWHTQGWEDLPALMAEVRQELKRDSGPIGVLAVDDEVAASFIEACHDHDIRIPEQLAVLGIHNDLIRNQLSAVPISSIEDGMHELGYQAASLLDRILDGDASIPDVTRVDPLGVISRKSTDITVETEPRLRRAMEFMKLHFCDALCNDDIAKAAGVSTRNLFALFNKRLDSSPGKALERIRVEHAKTMLRGTDEKIYTVAAESGLSSANNLHKVFKRVVGITPRDYRKKYSKRWDPPRSGW